MAIFGRLHPLLIHFPIALILAALAAEGAAILSGSDRWRTVAVLNVRAGAAGAVLAAAAGWQFALAPEIDTSTLLEWHRWLGTAGTAAALISAASTLRFGRAGRLAIWGYRVALVASAAAIGLAGHLGGLLVWGVHYLDY